MKLDKLIYSVREAVKAYQDDSELDDRFIIHLLDIKRAKYIRQSINNFQYTIDNSIIQKICVPVESASEYICEEDEFCNVVLRSKYKIPNTFSNAVKNSLLSVKGRKLFTKPFNLITVNKMPLIQHSKFPNNIYAVLETDGYLYLFSNSNDFMLLNCVVIEGIFESPLELLDLETCCENCSSSNCFDYDSDYPIPSHLIDNIITDVVQYLVNTDKLKEDKENNSTDDK